MSNYLPPHARNIKNLEKITKIKTLEEEFPKLVNTKTKTNPEDLNKYGEEKKSFAEITEKEENEEILNKVDQVKEGWSIIKKNDKSNIIIIESKKSKKTKEMIEYKNKLEEDNRCSKHRIKLIQNWNNYRDTENELRGDLSLYCNYEEEIEKMRNEDLRIEELMEEYYRKAQINSDSEDDESNRNLIS